MSIIHTKHHNYYTTDLSSAIKTSKTWNFP